MRHHNAATEVAHEAINGTAQLAEVAGARIREYGEKAKGVLHSANNTTLAEIEKKAGDYVRENPGRTIAAAAGIGLVIGFMMRRR